MMVRLCEFGNDEAAAAAFVPEINDLLNRLRQMPTCRAAQMRVAVLAALVFLTTSTQQALWRRHSKAIYLGESNKLHP